MTAPEDPDFVYLNRDNAWLDFQRRGLDLRGGRLGLAAVPSATVPLPPGIGRLPVPSEPAGVAVGPDGTVFFTDSDGAAVVRIDSCDGAQQPVPCLGGVGEGPTQLRTPGGLLVHPTRAALIVADSGNHRLQLFHLATYQLLDIWGDTGPGRPALPGAEPGRLDTPVDLDADSEGRVYVAERGNKRVQQFTAGGEVIPAFWKSLSAEAMLDDPVGVAVVAGPGGTTVCILDRSRKMLLVVDPDGHLLAEWVLEVTGDPRGLAVTEDAIYVGDNGTTGGAVLRLDRDGSRVGAAAGYTGPVAALALDRQAGLVVHPGRSGPPVWLALDAAFVRRGIAWGGPFGGFSAKTKAWHRLVATMAALPADAHVQFFVHSTDSPAGAPPVDETGSDPFSMPVWSPGPEDLGEFLIHRPATRFAWVGMRLGGEGTTSPAVEQIRLDFDRPTYVEHLPAMYRDPAPDAFLPRYLALAESLFTDIEGRIAGMSRLLDPAAAPPEFLAELARWLAIDVSADWDEADLRDAVIHGYAESETRGTASGLRRVLRRGTGIDAWIEEPIVQASWWALAANQASPDAERETSILGVSTMLAAAEPQGAVLGSTATVDRSHLIENAEYGVPLFDSVAHRFTVRLYQGATYSPERLRAIKAVLEREKPAHTEYLVCRVDPGLRIGWGRIGIDTVIRGEPLPTRLDDDAVLSDGLVLGGTPPGRVGDRSEIGVTTVLGSASVED